MDLDIDFVRSQFPAFQAEGTRDWIFFENAGGSYVPQTVIDRLSRVFVAHKVQPYAAYALSQTAGEEMDESYAAIAELLNAEPDEITIGPSTTLNFYVLAQGLRSLLRPGDEIVVTNQDHEANVGFWRRLSEYGVMTKNGVLGKPMVNWVSGISMTSSRTRPSWCVLRCVLTSWAPTMTSRRCVKSLERLVQS